MRRGLTVTGVRVREGETRQDQQEESELHVHVCTRSPSFGN